MKEPFRFTVSSLLAIVSWLSMVAVIWLMVFEVITRSIQSWAFMLIFLLIGTLSGAIYRYNG